MHPVIAKTFGGLSAQYYVRQFLFGLIFPALILFALSHGTTPHQVAFGTYALLAVNTLLYPYSRFVYESIVGYIMGGNVFFVNAVLMLFVKLMTMAICWSFAIFIAPIGLLYLYVHHSRRSAS
ncbi:MULTISPECIES: hypothetical protein [Pseudomonadota]|uniref:hypothetical protein n=1 Tax=Pseudomonadota TaxID=1224 RepID=UPI000247CB5A|nr:MULTISPECIES: hypothetical protein [Pseudomonadota]OOX23180.1 hypothetical protein Xazr_21025 [Xanthomonas campestris pv. azadirachtae]MBE0317749.1 hypothetical protein [Xanthomonas citri pv. punicae]MBN4668216.1 hypothetical protein [Pandoraea nosoerga]MBN4678068.1 hypothetical protein [Pandoraea nosoerga]MBN4683304.1 hypothetical protein [Pandoraea nosoerga]